MKLFNGVRSGILYVEIWTFSLTRNKWQIIQKYKNMNGILVAYKWHINNI